MERAPELGDIVAYQTAGASLEGRRLPAVVVGLYDGEHQVDLEVWGVPANHPERHRIGALYADGLDGPDGWEWPAGSWHWRHEPAG